MTMRNIITSILFLCFYHGFGQSFDEVFQKGLDQMKDKQAYEVNTAYKLYRGIDGTKVFEEYSGILSKKGTSTYQRLGGMELLNTDSYLVKLNHDDKEILVGKNANTVSTEMSTMDISLILQYFEKGTIQDRGNSYELEFNGKPGNELKIGKLLIHLNKKTNLISKQVVFFSYVTDFSAYDPNTLKKDFDLTRLEISYSNFKENINENNFNIERYFSIVNDKILIGKEFKDFEFFPAN